MKEAEDNFAVRHRLALNNIDTTLMYNDIMFNVKTESPYGERFSKPQYQYYIYDAKFKILHKNGILIAEFKTQSQFYKFMNLK
jgi:hypothetical protein